MNEQDLESYVELAAAQQGLIIDPDWRASVIAFYQLSARMAAVLEEHPLEPVDEPAPVFTA